MANNFSTPNIILDTFTSAVDCGATMFGNSLATFFIDAIIWQNPTSTTHTAQVTDGNGIPIFSVGCSTVNLDVTRYYNATPLTGIKTPVASGNLFGSGKIIIVLTMSGPKS